MWLVILLNMIGATGFTVGKALLTYLNPLFLVGVRMSIAGALLLFYYCVIRKQSLRIARHHWKLFAQIILVHIYGAYVLEFWAMNYVSSTKTSFLFNLNPFVTALLVYFLFSERLSPKKAIGLIIGFIGCMPMLFTQNPIAAHDSASCCISFLPDLAIMGSVVCFAYGWIVLQQLLRMHYSALFINGIGMLFGGLLSLITAYWAYPSPFVGDYTNAGATIILCLAWLVLVSSILFYTFYGYLLKVYSATFLAFAGFMGPLFAALYGWLFLSESIGTVFFISVFITGIGLYLFYQDELKKDLA